MKFIPCKEGAVLILQQQLSLFWKGLFDWDVIESGVEEAFKRVERNLQQTNIQRFKKNDDSVFSVYNTIQWSIFLYYLSNTLWKMEFQNEASIIYYLNKVMHSVDWYYEIELPIHFMAEHPLGSVLGRAQYGDCFMIYQGVTVGGNRKGAIIEYPKLGDNVLLYTNSTILGDTVIGNNVVVSAGTILLNERVPDNCIVFGRTPNIEIKEKTEMDMKNRMSHIWKWEN